MNHLADKLWVVIKYYLLNFQLFGQKWSFLDKYQTITQISVFPHVSFSFEKTHGNLFRIGDIELSGSLEIGLLPLWIELRLALGLAEEGDELLRLDLSLVALGLHNDCWRLLGLCLFVRIGGVEKSAQALAGYLLVPALLLGLEDFLLVAPLELGELLNRETFVGDVDLQLHFLNHFLELFFNLLGFIQVIFLKVKFWLK